MNSIPTGGRTGTSAATSQLPPPRLVPVAVLAGCMICIVGGFATGYMLTKDQVFGVVLLGVGALAGWISRKITDNPSRLAGQCIAAACVLSFCLAMVSWYRWGLTLPDGNRGRRDPTWQEAITRAPKLLMQFQAPGTLVISGLCAAFGAAEAFRNAGTRYRWVAVVDE